MLFNSLHFLIFFPIVLFFYFFIPHKYRWVLLLVASYYFYMSWNAGLVLLLLVSTLVNYIAALYIGKQKDMSFKKKYLIAALVCNLLLLGVFKYYNFFADSFNSFFQIFNFDYSFSYSRFLLPIGISFYTFQTISYIMDVYRGDKEPERHFGIFALYVSFFPQLVAGPIERSEKLLSQFYKPKVFDYQNASDGLKLMVWGLFKKVVIADRVAIVVNTVYGNADAYAGFAFVIATIFFAFQIYCDFSGYSDVAIGSAQMLGFNLTDNFKRPYFSRNIISFWQRWHISLSTWFKDYVYIPFGGNKKGRLRTIRNIMTTFLLSGLWHGANWTLVFWGALHGIYVVVSHATKNIRQCVVRKIKFNTFPKLHHALQILLTFSMTSFAWIFFRSENLDTAFLIIRKTLSGVWRSTILLFSGNIEAFFRSLTGAGLGLDTFGFIIAIVSIILMEVFHLVQRHGSIRHMLRNKPTWFRWILYYAVIIYIALFGVFAEVPFIYFQF